MKKKTQKTTVKATVPPVKVVLPPAKPPAPTLEEKMKEVSDGLALRERARQIRTKHRNA